MERDTNQSGNTRLEPEEILSAEPIIEAPAADVVEAVPGVVLARDTAFAPAEDGTDELASASPGGDSTAESTSCSTDSGKKNVEASPPHKNGRLKHAVECMLFVSPGPLSTRQLAEALQVDESTIEDTMRSLQEHLDSFSGLQLMRIAGGYQLCTRPEYADYCSLILQPARRKLSRAALETLAIIAYRQPCTIPEIEAVRGVSVDGVVKTLQERGLIKEAGRKHAPGRPVLLATTPEFLEYFGLNDLSELPDIDVFAVDAVKALEAQRELLLGGSADSDDSEDD